MLEYLKDGHWQSIVQRYYSQAKNYVVSKFLWRLCVSIICYGKRHGFVCANTFSDLPVSVYINVWIFRNSSLILGHEIKPRSDAIDVKITYCE